MRASQKTLFFCLLFLCLLPQIVSLAQETTPEAEVPTLEPSLTPSATNTPTIEVVPTLTFTPIIPTPESPSPEIPTAAVTSTPTESLTPSASSTATDETTSTVFATTNEIATATSTALATGTLPSLPPLPAEFSLQPLYATAFDTNSVPEWVLGTGWAFVDHDTGYALQVFNSESPAELLFGSSENIVVEARFELTAGIIRLNLNETALGGYHLRIGMDGLVELTRSEQILASGYLTTNPLVGWHTVRLSVMNGILRVTLDNAEIIVTQDSAPLPAGKISINAQFTDAESAVLNVLSIDDVSVWLPTYSQPTPPPIGVATFPPILEPTGTVWATLPSLINQVESIPTHTFTPESLATVTASWTPSTTPEFNIVPLPMTLPLGESTAEVMLETTQVLIDPDATETVLPQTDALSSEDASNFMQFSSLDSVETLEEVFTIDFDGQGSYAMLGCALGTGRTGSGWQCNRPNTSATNGGMLTFSPQCNVSYVSFDFRPADPSGYPHVAVALDTDSNIWSQNPYWYANGSYPAQGGWGTIVGYDSLLTPRYVDTFYIYLAHNQGSGYGDLYVDNIQYRCMPDSTEPDTPSPSSIIDFDGQGTYAPFRCGVGVGRENAESEPTAGWQCSRPNTIAPNGGLLSFSPQCQVTFVSFDFRSADPSGYPHVAVALNTSPNVWQQNPAWYANGGYPASGGWTTIVAYNNPQVPRDVDTFWLYVAHNQSAGYGDLYVDNIQFTCLENTPTPTATPTLTPTPTPPWTEDGIVPVDPNAPIPELQGSYNLYCPQTPTDEGYGDPSTRRGCALLAYEHFRSQLQQSSNQMTWANVIALLLSSEGEPVLMGYIDGVTGELKYNNPALSTGGNCAIWDPLYDEDGQFVLGADKCAPGVQRLFPWAVSELFYKTCANATGYIQYVKPDSSQYDGSCNEEGLVLFIEGSQTLYQDLQYGSSPSLYVQLAEEELDSWAYTADHPNGIRAYGTCPCSWQNDANQAAAEAGNARSPHHFHKSYAWFYNPTSAPAYAYFRVY